MKLTEFEFDLLNASGNASNILYKYLGKRIGKNNAEKQLAGIRSYLRWKQTQEATKGRVIGEMEESVITANGTVTSKRMLLLSEEDSKNPARLMQLMGYDPLQWELVSSKIRRNYWDVSMKLKSRDDEGESIELPHKETNHAFEVTITVKPLQTLINTKIIQEVIQTLKVPTIEAVKSYPKGNCVLEPSILDFHLGKGLSLQEEINLYKSTIHAMLAKVENYNLQVEKFKFQVGQDFINFDNSNKTTTSGTLIESNACPWSDVYKTAVDLLLWTAEQLLCIAPVDFYYVPGNHDKTLSYTLCLLLASVYANNPNVFVDIVDFPRKYWQYGISGIGMSHGRDEGKRIEDTMQQEAPEIWATTQRREYHLGDLHHESSYEKGGIVYRRTSAITDLDGWHINKAYRALRKAPLYVWHENGDRDILDVTVKI